MNFSSRGSTEVGYAQKNIKIKKDESDIQC